MPKYEAFLQEPLHLRVSDDVIHVAGVMVHTQLGVAGGIIVDRRVIALPEDSTALLLHLQDLVPHTPVLLVCDGRIVSPYRTLDGSLQDLGVAERVLLPRRCGGGFVLTVRGIVLERQWGGLSGCLRFV